MSGRQRDGAAGVDGGDTAENRFPEDEVALGRASSVEKPIITYEADWKIRPIIEKSTNGKHLP